MKLFEYEIWDDSDMDRMPDDEKQIELKGIDPSKWVKLHTWYNWDNVFDEILYFYKRDIGNSELYCVSIGNSDITIGSSLWVRKKKFDFDDGRLIFRDNFDDDDWEIKEGDLDETDMDSFNDMIRKLFEYGIDIENNIFSLIKR